MNLRELTEARIEEADNNMSTKAKEIKKEYQDLLHEAKDQLRKEVTDKFDF